MFFCIFQFSDTRRKYNIFYPFSPSFALPIFSYTTIMRNVFIQHIFHLHILYMDVHYEWEKDCTYTHDDDDDKIKTNFTA